MALLKPNLDRPNLTVLPLTLALRVVFEGTRAVGIQVDHAGEVRTLRAEREIVLSLDAYNSPHLLLQSGVGPADELTAKGIAPLQDVPDVDRNMQDHAGCFISFFSHTPPVLGPDTSDEEEKLRREGLGAMAWTEVGGFLYSSSDLPAPDIQLHADLGIVRDRAGQPH